MPAAVHYFHQVDDPYSHLAVQKLDTLRSAYSLPFEVHLCSAPAAQFLGSEQHFDHWALRDALSIADAYQTQLPENATAPSNEAIRSANNSLAGVIDRADFADIAIETGNSLWSGLPLDANAATGDGLAAVETGNQLRTRLGHYLGGMFYFQGEWYWGVDRLRLLEARLIEEGFNNDDSGIRIPEPVAADTSGLQAQHIQLEYFPSLRSPYTAIGHDRVLALIARSGVSVKLRPVMPMMMRGVAAPPAKQRYIMTDAAREGRAHGAPFGKIVDPFGEPVKQAFALFPGAMALNAGMEFVTAYLRAAWMDGTDITNEAGLRQVAQQAGIDWQQLLKAGEGTNWEAILDDNLNAMLEAGLWGVPSFRVSGGNDEQPFACWGQDRLWRVENEIYRRCKETSSRYNSP